MVKWGVGIPAHLPGVSGPGVVEYARRCEELGFDSVWVGDRIVFENLDPLLTLAAVAAATSTIEIAPTTYIAPARSPIEVAKSFATLDVLSNGRVRAVLSVGHRHDDYKATTREFAGRGNRLDEMIDIVRLAWSGEPVKYEGAGYSFDLGTVGPHPVRAGGIPLWCGGDSPRARMRAATRAAGHMSGTAGRSTTRALPAAFATLCRKADRDPATLSLGATAYFALGDKPRDALTKGMDTLLPYYGTLHWEPEVDVIWGPPQEAARRIVDYGALELETFVFVASSFEGFEELERLREVVDLVNVDA